MENKELLKTKEVCEILNISKMTLLRLEKDGKLIPHRRTSRSKYFLKDEVYEYLGIENESKEDRIKIAYARVSSNKQKNELKNQIEYLEKYSVNRGIVIDEYISDIGSGINYNNKGLLKIIDLITDGKVDELIISYKDRLVRFGFELIEALAKKYNTKITIINIQSTSPEEEVVNDLMTIVTVFSNRIYGLRRYNKKIKEDIENEKL